MDPVDRFVLQIREKAPAKILTQVLGHFPNRLRAGIAQLDGVFSEFLVIRYIFSSLRTCTQGLLFFRVRLPCCSAECLHLLVTISFPEQLAILCQNLEKRTLNGA